jgi:hypothetical protein
MKKTLNLVYDVWDENHNTPVPNGSLEIHEDNDKDTLSISNPFRDSKRFFEYYLIDFCYNNLKPYFPDDNNEVKVCKMEDVVKTPNEKFYYVISHPFINLYELFPTAGNQIDKRVKKNILTDEIIHLLKTTSNFFVIFSYEHESDFPHSLKRLDDFLKEKNIDGEKFYVINNNSNIYELKKKLNTKINVYAVKFIPNSSSIVYKYIKIKYVPQKNGKFFLCLNRGPKNHRAIILTFLLTKNLLNDTNWSWIPGWKYYPNLEVLKSVFGEELNDETINFFSTFKYKESDYELNKGNFEESNNFYRFNLEGFNNITMVPEYGDTYENSYIQIVTESMFFQSEGIVHITEKSLKPFYFYQLPIFVSSFGHIKKMKELYDLDFFDDILNHSYDNEKDDIKRMKMIWEEIERLHKIKNEVMNFYELNQKRFEENRKKISKLIVNTDDYLFLKNLI